MQTKRRNLRTFFAIHFFMWAVVGVVGVIDTMQSVPVDSLRFAVCAAVIVAGVGLGSVLIRRPRL